MSESKVFEATAMLMHTGRMHKMLIHSAVGDIGIHRTQHRILMHLAKCERLPSQKELADRLDITPAAVTCALKGMEEGGYIERTLGLYFSILNTSEFGDVKLNYLHIPLLTRTRRKYSCRL